MKLSSVIQMSLQSQIPYHPFTSYHIHQGCFEKNAYFKICPRSTFIFFFFTPLCLSASLCLIFLFSYTFSCCQHLLSSLVSVRRSSSGRLQALLLWGKPFPRSQWPTFQWNLRCYFLPFLCCLAQIPWDELVVTLTLLLSLHLAFYIYSVVQLLPWSVTCLPAPEACQYFKKIIFTSNHRLLISSFGPHILP